MMKSYTIFDAAESMTTRVYGCCSISDMLTDMIGIDSSDKYPMLDLVTH